jgi:hypothetical protein
MDIIEFSTRSKLNIGLELLNLNHICFNDVSYIAHEIKFNNKKEFIKSMRLLRKNNIKFGVIENL